MRFVCESCRAQYMINDEKVGPKGVKVRCRKCGYVIHVKRTDGAAGAAGPQPGRPRLRRMEADGSDTIHGTTFGYMGKYARGAQLSGPNENEYPYRAVGDSIAWQGTLRPEVGAKYDLRALAYGRESLRVGGTVALVMATE